MMRFIVIQIFSIILFLHQIPLYYFICKVLYTYTEIALPLKRMQFYEYRLEHWR